MGYRSLNQRIKDRQSVRRDMFRHNYDTVAKVTEFVERQGRLADSRLPGLYEQRVRQLANVAVLKVVGGDPLEKAEDALWSTNHQIQYDEPWRMLRDCLAAKLVSVEITALYVQFQVAGYRNRRICRFGPHDGLEFGQCGQLRQLTNLAKTAQYMQAVSPTGLQRGGGKA